MDEIVSIAERREQAIARRRAAIEAGLVDLRAYAAVHGGRFIVFGSVATGHVSEHSDLDLVTDFPDEAEGAVCRDTEKICAAHGVPVDIHPLKWASDKFLQRIGPHAFVIG